jgi:Ran GTPase-activating protein 1
MAPNTKIFSLEGKGLKLDTKEDVEVHIKSLREMENVEEIRLLGNTLGVEACKVLGEVLETKKTLQVMLSLYHNVRKSRHGADRLFR